MTELLPDTEALIKRLQDYGVPHPVLELRFYRPRRWRFDLAWPQRKVAVERHGFGRHIKPKGFMDDRDKMNAAACLGWRVIELTPQHLKPQQIEMSVRTVLSALGMLDYKDAVHVDHR